MKDTWKIDIENGKAMRRFLLRKQRYMWRQLFKVINRHVAFLISINMLSPIHLRIRHDYFLYKNPNQAPTTGQQRYICWGSLRRKVLFARLFIPFLVGIFIHCFPATPAGMSSFFSVLAGRYRPALATV